MIVGRPFESGINFALVLFVIMVFSLRNDVKPDGIGAMLLTSGVLAVILKLRDLLNLKGLRASLSGGRETKIAVALNGDTLFVRRTFKAVLVTMVIYFTLGALVGYFFTTSVPLKKYVGNLSLFTPKELFKVILVNNVAVLIVVFVLAVITGSVAVSLTPIFNSSILFGAVMTYGDPLIVFKLYILSHGVSEMLAYGLSAFSGVLLNAQRGDFGGWVERVSVLALACSVVLLVLSALVESYHSFPLILKYFSSRV